MFLQRGFDEFPGTLEVLFAVFGKKRGEARLLGERTGGIVFGVERLNL
jgi:hypothetical protein